MIRIIERQGMNAEVVAIWEDGEWLEGQGEWFTYDGRYEEYSAEQMIEEFDGPDLFAIPGEGDKEDLNLNDFAQR